MLHLLVEYARDEGLSAEPGFTAKDIRWGLLFNERGEFKEVIDFSNGDKKSKGRRFTKIPALSQPELIGGETERSQCFYDSAETVALLQKADDDEKKRAKAKGKHGFFVEALTDCAQEVKLPGLTAAAACLGDDAQCACIASALKEKKAKPGDSVTIAVGDDWLLDSTAWHDWWRAFRKSLSSGKQEKNTKRKKDGPTPPPMLDLITGEPTEPLRSHPKISGLSDVGGLATGDALISFDKDAFGSFSLEMGANAAISEENATIYQQAINHLIANHSRRLGKSKVLYWYKGKIPSSLDPVDLISPMPGAKEKDDDEVLELEEDEPDKTQDKAVALANARKFLEAIDTGEMPELANAAYYAMIVSGASGRVMIRDWAEGQFGQLLKNTIEWFDDLKIVARNGTTMAKPPKFMAVLGAIVRDLKELNTPFMASMWRVALGGRQAPIPQSALAAAYARFKIDLISTDKRTNKLKPFNHARMGLIKAYHIRKGVNVTPELNEHTDNIPYQCGRLMALLADIQRTALGNDIGAGVVQRYYAAASATPALVLGRLIRNSTFHLGKMKPGLAHYYTDKLAAILDMVKERIPRVLTLEEQTLFALGYYQQIAAIRKEQAEAKARKAEAAQNTPTTDNKSNQP